MTEPAGERSIRENAFARCPFSVAIERAEALLRAAEARGKLDGLVVPTQLSVSVVEDFTDSVRRHDALEFSWHPNSKFFPTARALLTVRPHAPQGSELQFSVAYVPPFGASGLIFDGLIGRHIARLMIGSLLQRLRRELERT